MLKDELAHILKGNRDHVDEQFQKNLDLVFGRAVHNAMMSKGLSLPSDERQKVCTSILWAYYRQVYFASGDYGGNIIVFQDADTLKWLAHLLVGFLGLRDVEAKIFDAGKMCPAMRDNKEAAGYNACRIITGLPFEGMMSWDVSNVMACCDIEESIILTTVHPSKWDVRATQKGEVTRIEKFMQEVFDLRAAIAEIKKQ